MNVAEANELLDRMAYSVPYYPGHCICADRNGAGARGAPHGLVGGLPCPLAPLDSRTSDAGVFDNLVVRFEQIQFDGAGVCRACHAMLPGRRSRVREAEALATHRPGCEVFDVLSEANRRKGEQS